MFFKSIVGLSAVLSLVTADKLFEPGTTVTKESLSGLNIDPPATAQLTSVYYAKGIRYHECVPSHPVHLKWYNVQTTATLYTTPNMEPTTEVGTMSFAPMNLTNAHPNSESRYPVFYNLQDGSFAVIGNPKNTTRNMGHHDESYIDDHITPVVHASDSGTWRDAMWVVRANSSQSAPPSEDLCTQAGTILLRPYESMYLFFTDSVHHGYPVLQAEPPAGKPEAPAGKPEPPAGKPEPPEGKPEPPAGKPEPPVGKPEPPVGKPEPPAGKPEPPAGKPEPPAGKPEPPVGRPELPATEPDTPAAEDEE